MPLGTDVNIGSDRSSPLKGAQPHFSVDVYCGQTAGWIKMSLGTEVNVGSGDVVLHGVAARP